VPRLAFLGSTRFVVGANLPWVGYGTDIGASAWYPGGGLSVQPASRELLDRTFATLHRDGVSLVRTFLLCDARSGVRVDDDGVPAGLDDCVFPDIDALLASAAQHHIGLMPVLVDFHLCKAPQIVNGVQLGGRSHFITDPAARSAFVDRVFRPIVERYRDEPAIVAWDVMNEPEWCLGRALRHALGAGHALRHGLRWRSSGVRSGVSFEALQEFLRQSVGCIQACTRQPVTIGCAGTWLLDLVTPLGLDFYQVHWYERFGWPALERPVAELGLDRPVILGEFSGVRSQWGIADVLDTARRAGYRAAFVWSLLSEDSHSGYPREVVDWAQGQSEAD
jgi:hypothetical protein